jgi:CRISPR-associated protein Cmr6
MPSEPRPLLRPLYSSHGRPTGPPSYQPAAHAGLWYDKFCNVWECPNPRTWNDCKIEKKLEWIKTVTDHVVGDPELLSEYADRSRRMIEALSGRCIDLVSDSRFVTGLGREHPVENGFTWHPTLGTPYLPGSSVKGIVRAWALCNRAGDSEASTEWEPILGKADQAGRIVLLDALPVSPVHLEVDVMTPHYADYYERGEPPGDWMSPNPIPLLVVAKGTRFQFGIIPRSAGNRSQLPTVEGWLREALEWLGGGAKTAVGYGRFAAAEKAAARPAAPGATALPPAPGAQSRPRPRYKPGDVVTATRVEDPKGKGRVWFKTNDGFGGTLAVKSEHMTAIAIGENMTLQIMAVLEDGYNFRLPSKEVHGPSQKTRDTR